MLEMRSEKVYFAFVPNSTGEDKRVFVEWLDLATNQSLGEMELTKEEFWSRSKEKLWEMYMSFQRLPGTPSISR